MATIMLMKKLHVLLKSRFNNSGEASLLLTLVKMCSC